VKTGIHFNLLSHAGTFSTASSAGMTDSGVSQPFFTQNNKLSRIKNSSYPFTRVSILNLFFLAILFQQPHSHYFYETFSANSLRILKTDDSREKKKRLRVVRLQASGKKIVFRLSDFSLQVKTKTENKTQRNTVLKLFCFC
jgi:hypothetical protein